MTALGDFESVRDGLGQVGVQFAHCRRRAQEVLVIRAQMVVGVRQGDSLSDADQRALQVGVGAGEIVDVPRGDVLQTALGGQRRQSPADAVIVPAQVALKFDVCNYSALAG